MGTGPTERPLRFLTAERPEENQEEEAVSCVASDYLSKAVRTEDPA